MPLALALPRVECVEVVEGALLHEQGILASLSPIVIADGSATSVAELGLGLDFTDHSPQRAAEPTQGARP